MKYDSAMKGWVCLISSNIALVMITVSEGKSDKKGDKAYEITYWSNLQTDNELIYKTKSGSRDLALTLLATKGKGLDKLGTWKNTHTHTHTLLSDSKQPTRTCCAAQGALLNTL